MEMLLPGWLYYEHLQAWYQCTFWVVWSSQKFVPSACVVHSQSCMLSCLSSILVLYMAARVEYQRRCLPAERTMNASKLGINALPGLCEICSKCVRRTQPDLHTFMPLQYTSPMAAIVYVFEYQW